MRYMGSAVLTFPRGGIDGICQWAWKAVPVELVFSPKSHDMGIIGRRPLEIPLLLSTLPNKAQIPAKPAH